MDVVVIFNGLGNQMSQYSFFLNKMNINKSTRAVEFCTVHNGSELSKVFNIKITKSITDIILYIILRILLADNKLITKPLRTLLNELNFKVIYENFDYNFHSEYLKPSKGVTFYYGGWPSEKYFLDIKGKVINEFKFTNMPSDAENVAHIKEINDKNSVAIHVRRGDYLVGNNINLFGGVCSKQFYEKAIQTMQELTDAPHFFIFSNDIPWVKENLIVNNVTYVTCNSGSNSWKDMYLMSICKHNIISNSTFSWWGAWLNVNKGKLVMCPTQYLSNNDTHDVYPESWIKLSS